MGAKVKQCGNSRPRRVCVCVCVCACALSFIQISEVPWTTARQVPLPMGFSRQDYWRGLPFPPPGDPPNPGIKPVSPVSPALADKFFTTSATWEALGPDGLDSNPTHESDWPSLCLSFNICYIEKIILPILQGCGNDWNKFMNEKHLIKWCQ